MSDESRYFLVLYPQHNEDRHNSSMNAFYEQTMLACISNGWAPQLACENTYSKILKFRGLSKKIYEIVSDFIGKISGWPGQLIFFSIIYRILIGVPNTISISQEYISPFFLKKNTTIVHDMIQEKYPRNLFAKYYYVFYIKFFLKKTNCFFVSETTRNMIESNFSRSPIIYNIFGNEYVDKKENNNNIPKIYDAMWIGTFAEHKDIKTVINAAIILPDINFCLITPSLPSIKLPKNIKAVANVSNSDISTIYDQTKILISTSLDEGYGRPAMEGRLKGMALILTDIPVFKELHSDYATFIEPRNAIGLARAIEEKLKNLELKYEDKECKRKIFSIDKYALELEKFF